MSKLDFMNEEKDAGDEEKKVSGAAAGQEERKIDKSEGVSLMLFQMICPLGWAGA